MSSAPHEEQDVQKNKKISIQKKGFQQKILDFYYNEFESIIKTTNRGPVLSQILIIFGTIQRMTSMFTTTIMNVLVPISSTSSSDNLMVYIRLTLSYLKIYPILQSAFGISNETEIFLIIASFINTFIFLYVFLRLFFFLYNYDSNYKNLNDSIYQMGDIKKSSLNFSSSKQETSQQKNNSKFENDLSSSSQYVFDKLVSTICQIYLHTLLMPSLDASFSFIIGSSTDALHINQQFIYVISIVNLIMTCLIGLALSVSESDYNFYLIDYMAKRDSIANTLLLMQDITFQFLYNTTQVITVIVIHIICLIIRLLYYCSELPYFYDPVSRLYGQITLMHFNFALILILNVSTTINQYANMSFIIVAAIPLSFKAGQVMRMYITKDIILRMQSQTIGNSSQKKSFLEKAHGFQSTLFQYKMNNQHKKQINDKLQFLSFFSPNQIDCYVREVFKQFIQGPISQYVDSTLGFYFESIYVNHIKECNLLECFCEEYKKCSDMTKEDFLSSEKREKFVTGYINHIFTLYFYRHKNFYQFDVNRLRFSFLTFLIQVCQIPTKAYVEVVSMGKFEKNASIREKFVYQSILRKTQSTFSKYFVNSTIVNQKLQMIQVIEFDDLVEDTTLLIFKALNKKYQFFQYLCQDYLNLNQLNKLGKVNIDLRNQIEQKILQIFDLNLYNKKAHVLADIYLEHFDQSRRKKKDLLLKSREAINNIRKKIKEINMGIYQIKQKMFQSNTVVVHISLLKPIGIIKRVSHNFLKIFNAESKNVLGQNVNILMPKVIGLIHNRILENFVEFGDMKNINKGEILLFGADKDQYIFPLETRFKLDSYSHSDFGVSASLTTQKDDGYYVLFDTHSLTIRNVSKEFIEKVDYDFWNQSSVFKYGGQFKKLQTFDLSKMILHILVFQEDLNTIIEKDLFSILIYPRNDEASDLIRNDRQPMDFHTYLNLAKDEQLFVVFSLFFRQKSYYDKHNVNLSYLEIQGINKIKKKDERIELINAMRHEFEYILRNEDRSYANPMLIEQLCYSLHSTQPQINQSFSSFAQSNNQAIRTTGTQSRRVSMNYFDPCTIEKRNDEAYSEANTFFTNETNINNMNRTQFLQSPPGPMIQQDTVFNQNERSFSYNQKQQGLIDLNWQEPFPNKQQQLALNNIFGDVISVDGQSFCDPSTYKGNKEQNVDSANNSFTNSMASMSRRMESPLSQTIGYKYMVTTQKGNNLAPKGEELFSSGQVMKELRRKSSEMFYTNSENIAEKINYYKHSNGEQKQSNFHIKIISEEPENKEHGSQNKQATKENQKDTKTENTKRTLQSDTNRQVH